MDVGERIKFRRKQLGLSAEQIAAKLGVSPATVYRYESKEIMNMRIDKLEPIAKALHTTPAFLMGWDGSSGSDRVSSDGNTSDFSYVQYAGPVAAHFNATPVEEHELRRIPPEWLGNRRPEDFFIASVDGNSMYPHYQHGDDILCLRCSDMGYSGRVGIMVFGDGEATLKKIKYKAGEDWIDLVPFNPEYTTKRIEGADLEQCRVVGRVIRVIRAVDDI